MLNKNQICEKDFEDGLNFFIHKGQKQEKKLHEKWIKDYKQR